MSRRLIGIVILCCVSSGVVGNYCLCNDIIDEQVCANESTYDGIC